jgi:phage terminase large subunit
VTAKRSWNYCLDNDIERLIYDSIGVGAGFKAKTNELAEMEEFSHVTFEVIGFNAGAGVVNPDDEYSDGKTNRDMFSGAKAQGMWTLRDLCHETYRAVVEGKPFDESKILSIPSHLPLAEDLMSEMSRPKREEDATGKVRVEPKKKMKARGIKSPNLLDGLVMCVAPIEDDGFSDMLRLALAANG